MYDFYMNLSLRGRGGYGSGGLGQRVTVKMGLRGAGQKNGHSFALNMYDFYMNLSHRGRGGYGSGGLGQRVTLKMGLRGGRKKMGIILPRICMISI